MRLESHICSIRGGCTAQEKSHLQYQGRLCSARRVTSAVPGDGEQYQESHTSVVLGGVYSARRVTSAVPEEVVQCKENHICSNRGGCAVPGKLHLQYQRKACSTKIATTTLPQEGV